MNGQKNDIGTQSRTHRPLRAGSAGFESASALPTDGAIGRLFDGDYAVRFCSLRANKIYHMVPVVPTGVAVCSLVASLRSVNVDASRKTNRAGSTNIHRASYNESVGLG